MTYLRINHQVRLQFDDREVVIESRFRLTRGGSTVVLDPEKRGELGPLLAIYPATLQTSSVSADESLRLEFADGTTIEVPPDERYEAWQVCGPGSRLVVCGPAGGGGLAVWT
jgi:hypothetical protein